MSEPGDGGASRRGSPPKPPRPPQPPCRLYDHAVEKMIERGYNLPDADAVLRDVGKVILQPDGNVVFVGRNNGVGVVVAPDTEEIVSVLRPGMVPE